METFKDCLQKYMEIRGFRKKGLALAAGLNETAVRDILYGRVRNVRIDTFVSLCRALNVKPHQLSPEIKSLYTEKQIELLDKIARLEEEIDNLS